MVAMLIDDSQYCGIAYVGPSKDWMFSVTAWFCATGYYTFGHELGHNLGCLHDRGTQNQCNNDGFAYGYRDPQARFRTILAYNCASGQCDGNPGTNCPKIQRFSSPDADYNGNSVGSDLVDNARQINNVRVEVSGYYTPPTPATPAPVTPAPVTPAPVTPAPVTPAPVSPPTPAPVTPSTPAPIPSPTSFCSTISKAKACKDTDRKSVV